MSIFSNWSGFFFFFCVVSRGLLRPEALRTRSISKNKTTNWSTYPSINELGEGWGEETKLNYCQFKIKKYIWCPKHHTGSLSPSCGFNERWLFLMAECCVIDKFFGSTFKISILLNNHDIFSLMKSLMWNWMLITLRDWLDCVRVYENRPFRVFFCLRFKWLHEQNFLSKSLLFAWKRTWRWNTSSNEWNRMETRFDTEAKGYSEGRRQEHKT